VQQSMATPSPPSPPSGVLYRMDARMTLTRPQQWITTTNALVAGTMMGYMLHRRQQNQRGRLPTNAAVSSSSSSTSSSTSRATESSSSRWSWVIPTVAALTTTVAVSYSLTRFFQYRLKQLAIKIYNEREASYRPFLVRWKQLHVMPQ
jgi:hypothetical protein